jgi:hypothetical protein
VNTFRHVGVQPYGYEVLLLAGQGAAFDEARLRRKQSIQKRGSSMSAAIVTAASSTG